MDSTEKKTIIKQYFKYELAFLYSCDVRTLNSWIKPFKADIGEINGYRFSPKQVEIIFKCIGEPNN